MGAAICDGQQGSTGAQASAIRAAARRRSNSGRRRDPPADHDPDPHMPRMPSLTRRRGARSGVNAVCEKIRVSCDMAVRVTYNS